MVTRRAAEITAVTIVLALVLAGCSSDLDDAETQTKTSSEISVAESSEPIVSPADAKLVFPRSSVSTVAAPVIAAPVAPAVPQPVAGQVLGPVRSAVTTAAPAIAAANQAPAQAAVPVSVVAPPEQLAPVVAAPESRVVYVGLAGGQDVVDLERGPVLFPLPAGFPPYVAEHDFGGGWARFGTLKKDMKVTMSGLVTGTYTVGQIINVPKHGKTEELRAFKVTPKVMLQTCIPGTSRMIVVGLY